MTDKEKKSKALDHLNEASTLLEELDADTDTLCALGGVIEEAGDLEVD